MSKKQIVVVGAGYGGLLAAVKLKQNLKKSGQEDFEITLVDKREFQLLTFDLYEVAASEEEFVSIEQLKKSITLPIREILQNKGVNFLQAEVKSVDLQNRTLSLLGKSLNYDYLILATGAVTDDFGIEGAKEFGLPLKTFEDGLRIRNRVEFAFEAHTQDMTKKNLRFVVAGGGYTGIEMAAELEKLKSILCWKYNYPAEKVEVVVIEAAASLVPGFSKKLSQDALLRLKELGVRVMLSSRIAKVTQQYVELLTGERIAYDSLVWSVGVKAQSLNTIPVLESGNRGRVKVNQFLQVAGFPHVYCIGDSALVLQKDGRPVSQSAQDAIDQAEYLSRSLPLSLKNMSVKTYEPKSHGFIVTLGGRWAIMDYNGFYLTGQMAYLARALAHMRYISNFYGWFKAMAYIFFQVKIFGRND